MSLSGLEVAMPAAFHLVATLLLAHAPTADAADQPPSFLDPQSQEDWNHAQELARHGIDDLLRSFELFKDSLPVYGAPYIDQNGNIVIPRQPRMTPPAAAPMPERQPDHT
jgi:hypothetical protein